ncbi:MAG TPA: deoxyribodipyrimidine photo-lyase [Actinomycetota bacterium]
MRTLVLFTRDLRVHDHPALHEAVRTSREVLPLFVLDPRLVERSPNRTRFLLEGLHDLDASLRSRFGRLIVRHGDPAPVALALAREHACGRVFVTSDASGYALSRERRMWVAARLTALELRTFPGHAVVEPGEVGPDGSDAYRLFTPYFRAWSAAPRRSVLPPPPRVTVPEEVRSEPIPRPGSVAVEAQDLPIGGERSARRHVDLFLRTDLEHYGAERDALAVDGTSRLSPYLRFGNLSATELVHRVSGRPGAEAFLRQLAWRDFHLQLLAADPSLAWRDLRAGPAVEPPPIEPGEALKLWQEAMTGIPLVDAGMRQLRREGWMHNRARMVTASFLTRRLGVPWQQGARHFARLLVDGDPASNAGGWQWAAGTGTEPRRSRTFNPVRQAKRFDPAGDYIRRYVSELASVPAPAIFSPWNHRALIGFQGYPEPVIPVRAD